MMQRTNIPPEIAQEVLASAPNAAEKGLSQFFTPRAFGTALAAALPKHRPVIVDLNCGAGDLLQASANETTQDLLGSDIDKAKAEKLKTEKLIPISASPRFSLSGFIQSDLTLLHPLLAEVDWLADLFVLNPPWRLHWHRARLAALAESEVTAVRLAWQAQEATAPKGTLDSTIATLMMALDRCTHHGEGLLIANNNTLERLLFATGAPFAALARHCWLRLIIPGNPMTGIQDCQWEEGEQFHTGVIYFARDHTSGPKTIRWGEATDEPGAARGDARPTDYSTLQTQLAQVRQHRLGAALRSPHAASMETYPRWNIAKERVAELKGRAPKTPWNLWLGPDDIIRTALSSFESASRKLDKAAAKRLFDLEGKSPMQLVMLRAEREELLNVMGVSGAEGQVSGPDTSHLAPDTLPPRTSLWRVQPELLDAVRQAIRQYHASRTPLYPLSDLMRLGYCDEADWLLCKKDLAVSPQSTVHGPQSGLRTRDSGLRTVFFAGRKYPLRTQTVMIEREDQKPNSTTGELEDFDYTGQQLAIFLDSKEVSGAECQVSGPDHSHLTPDTSSELTREYSFMDATLREPPHLKPGHTRQTRTKVPEGRRNPNKLALPQDPIDFTLQELVEHFEIPEVPDVATVQPERYQFYLDRLSELERLVA